MDATFELRTPRLILRRWRDGDRDTFRAMNADAEVMRHFPSPLSAAESDSLLARIEAHFETHGFGLFATEDVASGSLAGFVGLSIPRFEAFFTPCVEIGWRLALTFQGRGLATEGALAVMQFAAKEVGLTEVVSFTALGNSPSIRVMEKLAMTRDAEFLHPSLPVSHPLAWHVLYRRRLRSGGRE